MRKIAPITGRLRKNLKYMIKKGEKSQERTRAHAIMLNSKGYSIEQIADIFEVDRDSVSQWLNRWEEFGIKGIPDEARSGRPLVITEEVKKISNH